MSRRQRALAMVMVVASLVVGLNTLTQALNVLNTGRRHPR